MLLKKISPLLIFFPLLFQGCTNQNIIPNELHAPDRLKSVALKKVEAPKNKVPAVKPVVERPLSAAVLYHLLSGEIAGQRGQFKQAVTQYMRALHLEPDPRVAERAARIAVFARDDRNALKAAQIWGKLEPDNLAAQQVTAALLVQTGQSEAALTHFEKILSLTKATKNAEGKGFMLIVALLSKEQDKQAAMAVMDKLVARHEQNPAALYADSHLALLLGKLDKAATNINKVLVLKPNWIDAHLLQADILIRQGHNAEALKKLAAATEAHPDEIRLRLYYARKLIDEKEYQQAREQFKEVLERKPGHVDALYAMGLLGLQLRKLDQAQASFDALLKTGGRTSAANFYLGEIYEIRKQPQKAIQYYRKVTRSPQRIEAQIRIASLLAGMGKLDAARNQLHRIQAPTLAVALRLYLAEGELLQAAGQSDDAFELYTQALEKMPVNGRLLYARALVAEKIKRLDIAIQDLKLILKNKPNNIEALNALGYTLVDKTNRIQEGMRYIKEALARKPNDPAIMDSAGWGYYRLGKYDQSLKLLRQAYAKMRDPEIAAHLGEVLWVSGNQTAARKVWDDALQKTPKYEKLRKVMRRFIK